MREILFRGKRTDGQWIYGGLLKVTYDGNTYNLIFADNFLFVFGEATAMEHACVDPATVGQFTGLTDKNGKKIFEGDIVRYTFDSPDDPTATEDGLKVRTGRIFWSDWRASFAVTAGRNLSAALNNDVAVYVRGRQVYEYVRGANTVEVIGNIHDNPELLEK